VKYDHPSPWVQKEDLHPSDHRHSSYETRLLNGQTKTSRVGLVLYGTGRQGFVHLGNIVGNPRVELLYVVEADKSKWEETRDNWGLHKTEFLLPEDANKALADSRVDAVLVVTPTSTHYSIIMASLKASKHVFCEKPMAETREGIRECYNASTTAAKYLFCAFNRRFDPTFRDIFTRVRSGEIGKVQVMKSTSRDSPLGPLAYLEKSGGVFKDALVHDLDLLMWICGEFPTEVFVNWTNSFPEVAGIQDIDTCAVNLKFPSGTIAVVDHCRFASFGHDQRIEVFGRLGMLNAENVQPNRAVLTSYSGRHENPMLQSFMSRHAEGYKLELEHFLDVVQGNAEKIVTGEMTMGVAKICEACEESVKTGQKVILEWDRKTEIPEDYVMV